MAWVLGLLAIGGCAGQSKFMDDSDWQRAERTTGSRWRDTEQLFRDDGSETVSSKHVLRGVRHDLTMAQKAAADVRCTCMDVVIGTSYGDAKFSWAGERPKVHQNQMALALRTKGARCPEGVRDQRRPSIYAVDTVGKDIVVVVEELSSARPQALGAVISRPKPGGSVYLRSRTYKRKRLPYAWSSRGKSICKLYQRPKVRMSDGR